TAGRAGRERGTARAAGARPGEDAGPAQRRPARQHDQRAAQLHRGNRAQCDPAGARGQPLQQDQGGSGSGHHVPGAALQAQEARNRLMRAGTEGHAAPRFGLLLCLVGLLAFAVREAFVLSTTVDAPIRGAIGDYVSCAWHLGTHGVFSTTPPPQVPVADAYRLPGYPWLIALGMWLWPQDPAWTQLGGWYPFVLQVQVVLGSLTVVLVALLGGAGAHA